MGQQSDGDIVDSIERLENERAQLREQEGEAAAEGGGVVESARTRLEEIEVELDRLYDLRRQRRGLEDAGMDPDDASKRDADTVENYLQ
jgi:hypothetical protein